MDPAELQRRLRRLAQLHPGEHPYTLALRLQAETSKAITGERPSTSSTGLVLTSLDMPRHDRLWLRVPSLS